MKIEIKPGPKIELYLSREVKILVKDAKDAAETALQSASDANDAAQNAAQSEANAAQSEANAAQSAVSAVGSANAAANSENNAADSENNAEASANSASNSQTQAENARDEITDKIDFTDLQQGDMLTFDGAKLVKTNALYFQRFQNALSSIHPSQIQAWDDFQENEGEQQGRISPSGHEWQIIDLSDGSVGYPGLFTVANFQSKHSSNNTQKCQVLPFSEINGFFAGGVFSWGSNTTNLYVVFVDIGTGDCIYLSFSNGYGLYQQIGGAQTLLSSEQSDAFPGPSANSKTGGTFEISVTRRNSVNELHIGFKVAGYLGGFNSGAGDFFDLMSRVTHFGIGGFRGSALNSIRILKMWE